VRQTEWSASMDEVKIERRGGFAGLRAHLKLDMDRLAAHEKAALESLFRHKGPLPRAPGADRYIFTITRTGPAGEAKIEVPEHLMPPSIAGAVKDELP
jgi:hypothetical protein